MRYTWNEKKRESNLKKHSLGFEDPATRFEKRLLRKRPRLIGRGCAR